LRNGKSTRNFILEKQNNVSYQTSISQTLLKIYDDRLKFKKHKFSTFVWTNNIPTSAVPHMWGCQTSLSAKDFPWVCYQNWLCPWSSKNILLSLSIFRFL